jgi:S-adenosylmethionine uptake transporter
MSLDRAAPLVGREDLRRPDNLRGVLLMALAFALFAASDAQVKLLTSEFHPVQIVWTRQLGLLSGVIVLLMVKGMTVLATSHLGLQLVRGMLAVTSAAAFIFGLKYVPLADAVSVTFLAPLLVTIFSALLLKEKVGPRRLIAVGIGFIGTLIVIRPGFGQVHPAVMLVVLAATAFALRQVVSRLLAASDNTATTVAYTAIASFAMLSLPLALFWKTPETGWQVALLAGMAVTAALGELMVIKALQIAEASVVTPMHYTLIVWATLYGWLLFGHLPDMWTWVGAAIIVATGLYIMNRERTLKQSSKPAATVSGK